MQQTEQAQPYSSTGLSFRTTEAGTLQRDQFVRTAKSQSKWYHLHTETKKNSLKSDSVKSWNTGSSRLNSTYLRIARQAGIASNPPLCRPISQENLRKWERSARESSVICNQAAGFNRCLLKVQQNMQTQIKSIRTESKGKSSNKIATATDELQFLLDFNSSVCHAMAKAMEHLTDFVFVNIANSTLLRRDSYLSYLKAGVKADTLNALRVAPLVPKPNNKWRPILDLSNLNPFLKVEKFKMKTPETIRTSLQQGEWVTSIDFKDAYFHIPIQEQSRKYLRFFTQGRTYQFKALPFGLSTAPLEFKFSQMRQKKGGALT